MKVKFKTLSAGAGGIIRPGDVVEVSDSEGKLLIDCGYAENVPSGAPQCFIEYQHEPAPEPKKTRKREPK
jgi:hypothetical protein